MKITCLGCGSVYEIAEGASPHGVACTRCGRAPSTPFRKIGSPAYDRACAHARGGEKDAALSALEEALKNGVDPELVDSDPALGRLRSDPRFGPLVKRYRIPYSPPGSRPGTRTDENDPSPRSGP